MHLVGLDDMVSVRGEAKLTQMAAKAVHTALVRLHTHIAGHDKHVLGVAYQPRHDPGGDARQPAVPERSSLFRTVASSGPILLL